MSTLLILWLSTPHDLTNELLLMDIRLNLLVLSSSELGARRHGAGVQRVAAGRKKPSLNRPIPGEKLVSFCDRAAHR
jgi:hypothetical protein